MDNNTASPRKSAARAGWGVRAALILLLFLFTGGCLFAGGRAHLHEQARALYYHIKAVQAHRALAATATPAERADAPLVIYGDALGDGWQDWSWAEHNLAATSQVHSGKYALSLVPRENRGVYLHNDGLNTAGYGALTFYVHGRSALNICLVDEDKKFKPSVPLRRYLHGGEAWALVTIPLADLGAARDGETITGVVFQADGQSAQPTVTLDDIALLPDATLPLAPTHVSAAVTVDAQAGVHPISPLIYGMAFAPKSYLSDLRLGLNRWGGNDKSRYNWVLGNADNAARDWEWRNRKAVDADLPAVPSAAADGFVQDNKDASAQTLLTIPTLGWVARDANNETRSQDVPGSGGEGLQGADGAIAGYSPSANRAATSVPSFARKGGAFSDNPSPGGPVYQDEWVHHLVSRFGGAAHGGVRWYALDNEPDLWDATHTDVHPARMGYDDVLHRFLDYSGAVKAVDPDALVTGPVSWGWTGYQFSALDRGDDNFHTHADQTRHGGQWFVPWFLAQVHAHDRKTGHRSLDVLDLHFYPQGSGIYSAQDDKDTDARRLRAVRSLYDPSYIDESWINTPMRLIPRMKEWVAQNYPGTRTALTEWNFGAEGTPCGGLAVADALGVFGREGLDMACYWAYPPDDSAAYLAFKLFRNADGQGHGFGDVSCRAVSASPDMVSAYAAQDTASGALTIILLNKSPRATATVPVTLTHWTPRKSPVQSWRVSADMNSDKGRARLQELPAAVWSAPAHSVTLPPYSMTLLRVPGQ